MRVRSNDSGWIVDYPEVIQIGIYGSVPTSRLFASNRSVTASAFIGTNLENAANSCIAHRSRGTLRFSAADFSEADFWHGTNSG
jgi:hypothetical protein